MALMDDLNQRKLKRQQEANAAYGKAIGSAGLPGIASALATGFGVKPQIAGVDTKPALQTAPAALPPSTGITSSYKGFTGQAQSILPADATLPAKPIKSLSEVGITAPFSTPETATAAAPKITDKPAAAPTAAAPVNAPTVPLTSAENVALNDPQGGLGIRRIGDTYTNDPNQPGGVALGTNQKPGVVTGAVGGLSTYSNPETAGMSAAQTSQYWKGISAEIDARNAAKEQQAILSNSVASSSDSIGELIAKKANRKSAMNALGIAQDQQGSIGRAQSELVKETSPGVLQQRALEQQGAQLGIRGKKQELDAQDQLTGLQSQYLKATDDVSRRAIAEKIAGLQGKTLDRTKYQPIIGKDEMGNPQYIGAFDPDTGTMLNQPTQSTTQVIPTAGTVKNGYRFKGGNPNDQNNWEKA